MEQFEELQAWDLLVESRQYRAGGISHINLRNVADFAFMDMLSLYILYNEYETAPVASTYADKTIGFRNFAKARLSGTDLYISLNILSDTTSIFSHKIAQNTDADTILRTKLNIKLPTVKRYLDLIADAKISHDDAAQLLLRMEKQFNITDSKLRSLRRLVQDWKGLNTMQRSIVIDNLMRYYRKFAKRSELVVFLDDLGRDKGYRIQGGQDAEIADLGYKERPASHGLIKALAPAAGLMAGYKLGYNLFGPKKDK